MLPRSDHGKDQVVLHTLQKEDHGNIASATSTYQKQPLTHRLRTYQAYQLTVIEPGTGPMEALFEVRLQETCKSVCQWW